MRRHVSWGSYNEWSGPYTWGTRQWTLPTKDKTFADEAMFVLSETEGRLDAVQMYDRMICTVGMIQWGDAGQFAVADLLGKIQERKRDDPDFVMRSLSPVLSRVGATFEKKQDGRWRFRFADPRGWVDASEKQRALYHLRSDGKTWDAESRRHAIEFVGLLSTLLSDDDAVKAQIEFTRSKLMGFVVSAAKAALFDDADRSLDLVDLRWVKCARLAYVSFAANNPTWANSALANVSKVSGDPKWTRRWVVELIKQLTFFKGIKIYPGRYNAIRPSLEKIAGVTLPKRAHLIEEHLSIDALSRGAFWGYVDAQRALADAGFYKGLCDGLPGPKTVEALREFQRARSIRETASFDAETVGALIDASADVSVKGDRHASADAAAVATDPSSLAMDLVERSSTLTPEQADPPVVAKEALTLRDERQETNRNAFLALLEPLYKFVASVIKWLFLRSRDR